MSLSDTLAEMAALQQEQANEPPMVPPPGSPTRPKVPLVTPAPKPQAAPPAAQQKKGLLQSAADFITGAAKTAEDPNTYKAIGASIVRAPGQLIGGNVDTLADLDHFASDNMVAGAVRRALPQAAQMALSAATQARKANGGASLADTLSMRSSVGQVGNPSINEGSTQTLAVLGGVLAGGGEGLPASAPLAAKVGRLLLNSGKVGLLSGVTSDTTGNPNPLALRGKEAAAGAAINIAAEPLLGVVEHYIKAKLPTKVVTASPAEALTDKLDRTFASARTSEARYQAQELAGKTDELEPTEVHHLDQGTRAADGPGPGGGEPDGVGGGSRGSQAPPERGTSGDSGSVGGGPADLGYQDANHALKAVGSTETVDPEGNPLRPDGRIPISDASKAALDEAGMGRAFAAEAEGAPGKDPIIFKEEDPQGGSRVVGAIGKEDLQGFKDAATIEDLSGDHPVGQWKLSNLGASYDVPAFLRGLAEQLPEREVLNDVELMDTAKKAADAIGWEPEDMIAFAAHVAGDAKQMPTAMATIRTVYARAAQSVDDLLHGHSDWTALPDAHPDVQNALAAVHNIMTLGQAVAEFKTAAGQTLRVAGLPDADAYFASFGKTAAEKLKPVDPLDGLPKLPRNKDELKKWLDAWEYTKGDPQARDAFIKGLTFMPGKWMALRTSFANFYTAGIISAVATFGRDLLGPAIIGSLRTLERTTGGYAAAINPFIDSTARQDLLRTASQAPQAYLQTFGAAADAFRAALKATGAGGQLLQPSTVYDLRAKTIPKGLMEAATQANPGVTGRIPYVMANVVNIFPQWIHALHGGVNEFAQRLSYLGEVRASAMLEAAQQGLQGDAFGNYVRQRLLGSTDEVTWAARDSDALASSQRTTLIKPVGGDNQPIVSRVSDLVQTMRSSFPESRYILPIFTVPANAIGEGLRRIPVVGQLFAETQAELSGQAGAAAQAEAYGRFLSGASTMMAGMAMARAGLITGPGPTQPKDREIWDAQGFQPYSIRIGDQWVSYNRLDVVGNLLAIPAAIYDHSVHTQLDNQSAAFAGVAALAQYFKDQSALQGVADLMSFGGSPQESQGFLRKLTNQTVSGFVPNFITQLGRNNLDPDKRTARTPFEAILNKLPGASQLLDPQRNPLGEETMKVQNAGWNLLPISLTTANSYSKDPVVDELDRLYQSTGFAPGIKSPSLSGGKEDMRDIKLEDGHSLYDAMVRYRGFVTDDSGQTLRQSLQSLIDSPEYNQAADGDADNRFTADGTENRAFMVSHLIQRFDQLATKGVASDSPMAARYLAIGAVKRQNDAQLRDTPTEDIAKNPALLSALGINLGDYEDKVRGQ